MLPLPPCRSVPGKWPPRKDTHSPARMRSRAGHVTNAHKWNKKSWVLLSGRREAGVHSLTSLPPSSWTLKSTCSTRVKRAQSLGPEAPGGEKLPSNQEHQQQQSSYCTKPLTFWGLFFYSSQCCHNEYQTKASCSTELRLSRPRFASAEDVQGTEAFLLLRSLPQAAGPVFVQSSQQLLGYFLPITKKIFLMFNHNYYL